MVWVVCTSDTNAADNRNKPDSIVRPACGNQSICCHADGGPIRNAVDARYRLDELRGEHEQRSSYRRRGRIYVWDSRHYAWHGYWLDRWFACRYQFRLCY